MTEQKKNAYDDDDLDQIITEIEELEAEKRSVRSSVAGKIAGIGKKIEAAKKRARELKIPRSVLLGTLKVRALERQIADVANGIPDDEVELFEDAIGQFSFLKPEQKGDTAATVAARQASSAAREQQEREQEEGSKLLDDIAGGKPH